MKKLIILILCASPLFAQIGNIYAVPGDVPIKATWFNPPPSTDTANHVWVGNAINLFGGKNETVSFKLILENPGAANALGVSVVLASLYNGTTTIQNTSADPYNYAGRQIDLFTIGYTDVTQRSVNNGNEGNGSSKALPDSLFIGLWENQLIPFEAPVKSPANGIGGAPFTILAHRNQGVWCDIYIPRTATQGTYTGTLYVTEGGFTTHSIPVSLQVYNFTLSDTTHTPSLIDGNREAYYNRYYPSATTWSSSMFRTLNKRYEMFGHRHRIAVDDGREDTTTFKAYVANYITGAAYAVDSLYDGPGLGVGNPFYSIGTYDQSNTNLTNHSSMKSALSVVVSGFYPNVTAWRGLSTWWETWFTANAPITGHAKYMCDEIALSALQFALFQNEIDTTLMTARWVRDSVNNATGQTMRLLLAKEYFPTGVADGATDSHGTGGLGINFALISGAPSIDVDTMIARKSQGTIFGMYNGSRPFSAPIEILDTWLTDNRVNPWIAMKYDLSLIFQWTGAQYAGDNYTNNVWASDKYAYSGGYLWGQGDLIYAGRDTLYPGDSRGLDGPIGSIRINMWRRGIEDMEYYWLAKQWGDSVAATVVLNTIVPGAFNQLADGSTTATQARQPEWSQDPYAFERAREALANILDPNQGGVPGPIIVPGPYISGSHRMVILRHK